MLQLRIELGSAKCTLYSVKIRLRHLAIINLGHHMLPDKMQSVSYIYTVHAEANFLKGLCHETGVWSILYLLRIRSPLACLKVCVQACQEKCAKTGPRRIEVKRSPDCSPTFCNFKLKFCCCPDSQAGHRSKVLQG